MGVAITKRPVWNISARENDSYEQSVSVELLLNEPRGTDPALRVSFPSQLVVLGSRK